MKKVLFSLSFLAISLLCGAQTVVLDAGHGGDKPGAMSVLKEKESDINLKIVKMASEMLKERYPQLKVHLTRSKDVDVSLRGRAEFTNNLGADLFLTVHCNAIGKPAVRGYAVYILGTDGDQRARPIYDWKDQQTKKQEITVYDEEGNEVQAKYDAKSPESQLFFEQQTSTYNAESLRFANIMLGQLQAAKLPTPAWKNYVIARDVQVLWNTACPSALLECLFLTNPTDAAEIKKEAVKRQFAEVVVASVAEYFDLKPQKAGATPAAGASQPAASASEKVAATQPVDQKPSQEAPKAAPKSDVWYGVQVFVLTSKLDPKDKAFKGNPSHTEFYNNRYYYFVGKSSSLDKTRATYNKVKGQFQGCYIVKFEDGKISRVK